MASVVVDGIYYVIDNSNYTASVNGTNSSGAIVIPTSIKYDSKTYRVTSIGDFAFSDCSGLTSISIPNSVTSIGEFAFDGCSGLTSISIPNSVTSIGQFAFSGCSGLTSLTIPSSVTSIGQFAFRNSILSKLQIEDGNQKISIGTYAFHALDTLYLGRNLNDGSTLQQTTVKHIVISEGITSIGSSAFWGCNQLTSITIPSSVTSIGESAFQYCDALTSITIPNGIKSIDNSLFRGCDALASITIPNSVTSIGESAFRECDALTSITIPNSVKSIGESAFKDCSALTSITIPNSVTSIGESAFQYCSALTSITIPNSVTSIGESAFQYCSALTSITIPNSITSVGSAAFSDIKKVIWLSNTPPSGYGDSGAIMNYVSNDQYTGLSNAGIYPYLGSMFDVDGVVYVPVNPTERTCDAIDCRYDSTIVDVKIGKTVEYRGVEMKVNSIQPYFSCNNKYIESVAIDVDGIIPTHAFSGCSSLDTVKISNGVTTIGDYAFEGCTSLKDMSMGSGVQSIGQEALSGCTALTSLESHSKTPPTCGSNAFKDIDKWECTLHIPSGTTALYTAADQWRDFFVMKDDATGISGARIGNDAVELSRYNLSGQRISGSQRGVNIIRMSDGTTMKVMAK